MEELIIRNEFQQQYYLNPEVLQQGQVAHFLVKLDIKTDRQTNIHDRKIVQAPMVFHRLVKSTHTRLMRDSVSYYLNEAPVARNSSIICLKFRPRSVALFSRRDSE